VLGTSLWISAIELLVITNLLLLGFGVQARHLISVHSQRSLVYASPLSWLRAVVPLFLLPGF
jgi:hypothetical protein